MFHPTRGGTRGGRDQFKWEDVKEDKYRENYLGNSLHAAVGRWQKGRDLTWYAKSGDDSDQAGIDARQSELQRIKDAEAEAMAQALGVKTKRKVDSNITEKELKSAINKSEAGGADNTDDAAKESSNVQGLGFSKSRRMMSAMPPPNGGKSSSSLPAVPLVPLIPQDSTQPSSTSRSNGHTERSSRRRTEDHDSHGYSSRRRNASRSPDSKHRRRHGSRDRDSSRSRRHRRQEDDRRRSKSRSRSRSRSRDRGRGSRKHTEGVKSNRSRSRSRENQKRRRSRSRSRGRDRDSRRHRSRSTSRSRHDREGRDTHGSSSRQHRRDRE